MADSGYTDNDEQKALEAALFYIGKRLLRPPFTREQLLRLLAMAEFLLSDVHQQPPKSMADALRPAMQAMITDDILKHSDLKVQVAVASCTNELTRITAPIYPYTDDHMREIFQFFMVAFKQLSSESQVNNIRALRILRTVATVKSCLIMLDIEIDPMVVEMFQIFFNTIRTNHSSAMFDHMKTIMILIIKESEEISLELLGPLLSSVKMVNKNASPRSWELGKCVLENCPTELQSYIKKAVKAMNLNLDDYDEIIDTLCKDQQVGNEEVTNVQVESYETASIQVVNEAGVSVQFVTIDASGDGESKLDGMSQAGPNMDIQVQPRKRGIKPNTLMRPEEGYEQTWLAGSSGSFREYYSDNKEDLPLPSEIKNAKMSWDSSSKEIASAKKINIGKMGQCKKQGSMMNQDNAAEASSEPTQEILQYKVREKGSNKPKKTTKGGFFESSSIGMKKELVNHSAIDSEEKDKDINSQEHEAADDVEKVVDSPLSTPAKEKQSREKVKGFHMRKKTTRRVVARSSLDKEQVENSDTNAKGKDENDVTSQKHESGDTRDKVVESPMSKPAKAKQFKVQEKGTNKREKKTKQVMTGSSSLKEQVYCIVGDGKGKDENEIIKRKNELEDAVNRVVESFVSEPAKAKQSNIKEKGSKTREKTTEKVLASSSRVDTKNEQVKHPGTELEGKDRSETSSQKGDVVDKVMESRKGEPAKAKQSKEDKKGSNIGKKTTKRIVAGSEAQEEQVNHSPTHSEGKDANEISSQKHVWGDAVEKRAETKQSKVKEKGSNIRKKTTKQVIVGSCKVVEKKEQVVDSEGKDENEITSQKHESGDVADKVLKSPMSKCAKARQSVLKGKGSNIQKEKEKETMDFQVEYGPELVNLRIMVWWQLDQTYYTGTVESFDPVTKKHKIKYDDDEEEVLNMSEERWELFKERQPQQMQSFCEQEADHPSPAKGAVETKKKTAKQKVASPRKQHAGLSSKRSKSEVCGLVKPGHFAPDFVPLKDGSDGEKFATSFLTQEKTTKTTATSLKKQQAGSSSKKTKSEGHILVKSGHSAPDPISVEDESYNETYEVNFSTQEKTTKRKAGSLKKLHPGSSLKRAKGEGGSLMKAGHSVPNLIPAIPVIDESDDEMREANFWSQVKTTKGKAGSSKKQHASSSSKRSKGEGHTLVTSGLSVPDSIPVIDESEDETSESNFWTLKQTAIRKAISSKKQHTGSLKRSKGEGRSLMKSGHSAPDPIPVRDNSDDERCEANFSATDEGKSGTGKKELTNSEKKGKPSCDVSEGAFTDSNLAR